MAIPALSNQNVQGRKKCFERIVTKLPAECYLMTDETIQSILSDKQLLISHRILANWFFQFVDSKLGNEDRKKRFIIEPNANRNMSEFEVYSPEIYQEYILHTKKTEMHIPHATRSQYYANMWLFSIMHLIDTWRPSDIVNNLPAVDLDGIKIEGLDWFLNNELSREQAQIIINQVYLKIRGSIVSKNSALLPFLVPPEFVLPTGTAFVICELHRRENEQKYLLETLITINYNARKPNKKHLKFFKENERLIDFKSLPMNRSTMTYLFNSIVSESPDPELALTYTQQTRSHEKESSTAVYIKSTNYDGSIGNVSLNLLYRGHFGWLYNTLIRLMFEDTDITHSMNDRTNLIMDFRKEFSPTQIENWSLFLQNMEHKKEVILHKLLGLSNEDIKGMIGAIYKGEMPSREEHGQCLTFPNCEKPNLNSCFSCEYFIPQVYVLIYIKHEIERLFSSLESSRNQTVLKRDSYFLKLYLLLLNEAISVFGKPYIGSLIDIEEVKQRMLTNKKLII